MKRILFFLALLPISLLANDFPAYYPQGFKDFVLSSSSDSEIKKKLKKVLTSAHIINEGKPDKLVQSCHQIAKDRCYKHKKLNYREARKIMFGRLHLKRNGKGYFVKDVYCEKNYGPNQRNRLNIGPGIIPPAEIMNCEHTWPQSKFSSNHSRERQKTDLHHLFPSNSRANSARGNYNFANVNGDVISGNCTASSIGSPRQGFFRNYHFQPPKAHRGNVARAIFYFSIRYDMKINDIEERALRRWHKEDPVDSEESIRNDAIHEVQGNRNPFIDLPELASRIQNF